MNRLIIHASAAGFACTLLATLSSPAPAQELLELPVADQSLNVQVDTVYSVGAVDGEEWETFSSISSIAFDMDGNLLILDRGNSRAVKVGPDGSFVGQIGRSGEGPGEFGSPSKLAVLTDGSIAVFDRSRRGFTLFHPDGSFDKTVPLTDALNGLPGGELLPHPSGSLVSSGTIFTTVSAGGAQTHGDSESRPLNLYSLADGSWQTFHRGWRPTAPPPPRVTGNRAVSYSSSRKVFEAELLFGVLPDGSVAVVDSVTFSVQIVGIDGEVKRVLHRPIPPREVTDDDKDREKGRRREQFESGRGGAVAVSGVSGSSVVRRSISPEVMEARIENLEFAEEIQVVEELGVDADGRIWVKRSGAHVGEEGPIDLLTADGRYLGSLDPGRIRFPEAFGPKGLVAYVEKDELDVPRVLVMRVDLG